MQFERNLFTIIANYTRPNDILNMMLVDKTTFAILSRVYPAEYTLRGCEALPVPCATYCRLDYVNFTGSVVSPCSDIIINSSIIDNTEIMLNADETSITIRNTIAQRLTNIMANDVLISGLIIDHPLTIYGDAVISGCNGDITAHGSCTLNFTDHATEHIRVKSYNYTHVTILHKGVTVYIESDVVSCSSLRGEFDGVIHCTTLQVTCLIDYKFTRKVFPNLNKLWLGHSISIKHISFEFADLVICQI